MLDGFGELDHGNEWNLHKHAGGEILPNQLEEDRRRPNTTKVAASVMQRAPLILGSASSKTMRGVPNPLSLASINPRAVAANTYSGRRLLPASIVFRLFPRELRRS